MNNEREVFDTVLAALKRAREGLYNGFEPDNQSTLYYDIDGVIKSAGIARASFVAVSEIASNDTAFTIRFYREVIDWNRRSNKPLIVIGYESEVAGAVQAIIDRLRGVQSAIGRTCPENNLPCERACLGGWCQTMFGFPPEDELVPADRKATDG